MARIPAAERRTDLVNAAVRMIATHGVDGATTRRIAESAGAPLATLHYCFATKEILFAAVFERVAAEYREVLVRNDSHSDLHTTAREILRGLMNWYLDTPDYSAASVELISWAQRQEGNQAAIVYNEAYDVMRTILTAAAGDQTVSADTIDEISYTVAALSDGFGLNWIASGDRATALRQIETTVEVLDVWLASKLARPTAVEHPKAPVVDAKPTTGTLVSWVSV